MSGGTLVVGIGNRMRHDDGVGLAVAARMASNPPPGTSIVGVDGDCFSLLDIWSQSDQVYVVDAAGGSVPGCVHRVDCATHQLPSEHAGGSTHGFGVWQAVELAQTLGRLPAHLVVVAVTGADFGIGEGLSPPVQKAVGQVVDIIRRELEETRPG